MNEYIGEQEQQIYSDIFKDWSGVRPDPLPENTTVEEWKKEIDFLSNLIREEQDEIEDTMEHLHTISMEDFKLENMNLPVPFEEPFETIAEELEINRII